jgi:hypothetical protein
LSDPISAARNQLACDPGSQSEKRGYGIAFGERGGPHPHALVRPRRVFCIRWNSRVNGLAASWFLVALDVTK